MANVSALQGTKIVYL